MPEKINKMPEFYLIFARKIYFPELGGQVPLCPRLLRLCSPTPLSWFQGADSRQDGTGGSTRGGGKGEEREKWGREGKGEVGGYRLGCFSAATYAEPTRVIFRVTPYHTTYPDFKYDMRHAVEYADVHTLKRNIQ